MPPIVSFNPLLGRPLLARASRASQLKPDGWRLDPSVITPILIAVSRMHNMDADSEVGRARTDIGHRERLAPGGPGPGSEMEPCCAVWMIDGASLIRYGRLSLSDSHWHRK